MCIVWLSCFNTDIGRLRVVIFQRHIRAATNFAFVTPDLNLRALIYIANIAIVMDVQKHVRT